MQVCMHACPCYRYAHACTQCSPSTHSPHTLGGTPPSTLGESRHRGHCARAHARSPPSPACPRPRPPPAPDAPSHAHARAHARTRDACACTSQEPAAADACACTPRQRTAAPITHRNEAHTGPKAGNPALRRRSGCERARCCMAPIFVPPLQFPAKCRRDDISSERWQRKEVSHSSPVAAKKIHGATTAAVSAHGTAR